MKKTVLALWIFLSTALLMAGGNVVPIEETANRCYADKTYLEKDADLMWQDQKYTDAEDGAYANERSTRKAGKWN